MITEADLRPIELFAGLTDEQLAELVAAGREVAIEPGVTPFVEGDHADDWWVLVDGALELVRRSGGEESIVGRMDVPGRWAGGFRAWADSGVYLASGRGIVPGRLLCVPASDLRELVHRWFPLGGHLIDGLYGLAHTIESTARQRDALVTLGTLAAGLAHEINNPAAAASRAADSLSQVNERLGASLARLAQQGISADQFIAVDAVHRELAERPAPDRLDAADIEDDLSTWLERRAVERSWAAAPVLAAAGADIAWCEALERALPGDALGPGIEWIVSGVESRVLLAEITESTHRVSELVAAVRSYSQVDRASLQEVDVTEGIKSTLLVLGHRLRQGVSVVQDHEDVPSIEGYAGELNQVWTNLVGNAIDAMAGRGTLRIATRAGVDGGVVVEVCDTGTGMSPEVAARAFEAFYTTKEVGQGTGLGLDIARRIVVERHGGTIEIESQPGDTVVRVTLLPRPPSA